MTSARKILANRINARKGRGPSTRAGKLRASRNALRHGLFAASHRNPVLLEQIERMANAICDGDQNPLLFQQAVVIAENELLLGHIVTERVARIERLRNPMAMPLVDKADIGLAMANQRSQQRELAYSEMSQLKAKLISQGEEVYTFVPERKCEPGEPIWKYEPPVDRDEFDAMREAIPDLERLQRYERRVWSRRKRAIYMFIAIKLTSRHDTFTASGIESALLRAVREKTTETGIR
jgi:hypothetical protein